MGKSKQAKEKKFDRNVEISAPFLDPEIIKAIHTPPKGQRLDIKHGGFKALLSDLNCQDSTDELMPLNDNHVPSYIGISCAVSGYSNYSSYSKKPAPAVTHVTSKTAIINSSSAPNRSRATSPVLLTTGPEVHHITVDKNTIHSADEERKELTEKLTASATDRRRSPSPCIPPTEDDRHHGAYVGARYCPLPAPSKIVNKHIPLLGIDDEQNPDERHEEENKVEHRIASLYGGDFVEDWRESMTHKAKKELATDQVQAQTKNLIKPKDLVNLKPTPPPSTDETRSVEANSAGREMPVPNIKVLANVERQFLNKLLTDENPPVPAQPPLSSPVPTKSAPATREDIVTPSSDDKVASRGGNSVDTANEFAVITPVEPSTLVMNDDIAFGKPVGVSRDDIVENKPNEELGITAGDDTIIIDSAVNSSTTNAKDDIMRIESTENSNAVAQDDSLKSDRTSKSAMIASDDIIEIEPTETLVTTAEDDVITNRASTAGEIDGLEQTSGVPMFLGSGENNSSADADLVVPASQSKEEHIEYEIRAQSPVDNESSPVKENLREHSEAADLIGEEEEGHAKQTHSITSIEEPLATSDSKDGRFYLGLLDKEKSFIMEQVARAEAILEQEEEDTSELDEDKVGRLRSAIGKANLLVNKKFNQFKELCEANINRKADEQFATLNDDLAGFWDMLRIQVGDVQKSFESLGKEQNSRGNGSSNEDQGQVENEEAGTGEPREKAGGSKRKLSAQKDQARRERLKEHISQMKKDQAARVSNDNLLED